MFPTGKKNDLAALSCQKTKRPRVSSCIEAKKKCFKEREVIGNCLAFKAFLEEAKKYFKNINNKKPFVFSQ